tara:strand:- start:58 stop:774 length:717 start_codon:yes stop_codon:yes gene_type:complete
MRYLFMILFSATLLADNEIFVEQSGSNAAIDLEQLGSDNLIGGTSSVSGNLTALDLDGATMTLDINQIGSSNIFRSDAIDGGNFTGFFEFDGDSNEWDLLMNSTGLLSTDYVNLNIDVTGSSNTADIKIGEDDDASYLDLDWIILGDSNELDFDIDYEYATNYMDINGSTNTVNFSGSGYGASSSDAGYFYLDLDGSNNTLDITQASTLARDWLKITTNASNSNICVVQNDGGTATSC